MMTSPAKNKSAFYGDPTPTRLWHLLWLFFLGLWLITPMLQFVFDVFVFYQDNARTLDKAVEIVDEGKLIFLGNPFFGDFRLGPLANYFTAIPLLFSRNLLLQYAWVALLLFLAMPMYYKALRALGAEHRFALYGVASFGLVIQLHYEIDPVNNNFVPLFLALYLYLLAKALHQHRWAMVAIWPLIGLLTQLHLSTMIFVPITWLAYRPHKQGKYLALTILGLALFLITQLPLLYQVFDYVAHDRFAAEVTESASGQIGRLFPAYLLEYLRYAPYQFGGNNTWIGLLALLSLPWWMRAYPQHRSFFITGLAGVGVAMVIFPFLGAIKGKQDFQYFHCINVFWLPLVVFFLTHLEQWARGNRRRQILRVIVLGYFFLVLFESLLLVINSTRHSKDEYFYMYTFNDQLAVAERLIPYVEQLEREKTFLVDITYDWSQGHPTLQSDYSATYYTLLSLLRPDLRERLVDLPKSPDAIYVHVVPRRYADQASSLPLPPGSRVADRFTTPHLYVRLLTGPTHERNDILALLRSVETAPQSAP